METVGVSGRDDAAAATRVRYGRAVLTVRRRGEVLREPALARAIVDLRHGAVSEEDVAWAFARSRVQRHSQSFDWETADLSRVLAAVATVSSWPAFDQTDVSSVVQRLVAEHDHEAQAEARVRERRRAQVVEDHPAHVEVAEPDPPQEQQQPKPHIPASEWGRSIVFVLVLLVGAPLGLLIVLYLVLTAIVGGRPF
jgi:hypothetical protein